MKSQPTLHTPAHLGARLCLLALVALSALCVADTITYLPESGKQPRENVVVKAETSKTITWEPLDARQAREEPSWDVLRVDYDDAPDEWKRGINYFNRGAWYDARISLSKVLEEANRPLDEDEVPTVRRWWVQQYANYYLAECYRERGAKQPDELASAITHYQAVIDMDPPSRLFGPALVGLGLAQAAAGNVEEGLATLARCLELADSREIAPRHGAEALRARAQIHTSAGNASAAASDYRQLAGMLQGERRAEAVGYLLEASFALLASGDENGAAADFERIKTEYPDVPLAQAGAGNGAGLIALRRGDARQARDAFAATIAHRGATGQEYLRALKGLADALRALSGEIADAKEQADSLIRELRVLDPGSPFLEGEAVTEARNVGDEEGEE